VRFLRKLVARKCFLPEYVYKYTDLYNVTYRLWSKVASNSRYDIFSDAATKADNILVTTFVD